MTEKDVAYQCMRLLQKRVQKEGRQDLKVKRDRRLLVPSVTFTLHTLRFYSLLESAPRAKKGSIL